MHLPAESRSELIGQSARSKKLDFCTDQLFHCVLCCSHVPAWITLALIRQTRLDGYGHGGLEFVAMLIL